LLSRSCKRERLPRYMLMMSSTLLESERETCKWTETDTKTETQEYRVTDASIPRGYPTYVVVVAAAAEFTLHASRDRIILYVKTARAAHVIIILSVRSTVCAVVVWKNCLTATQRGGRFRPERGHFPGRGKPYGAERGFR